MEILIDLLEEKHDPYICLYMYLQKFYFQVSLKIVYYTFCMVTHV